MTMNFYLLSFVCGSIILQIFAFFILRKNIHKKPLICCIVFTFFAMLGIEFWAIQKGLWEWSNDVTLYKTGNIPVEELMLYCTSATTAAVIFEIYIKVIRRFTS